MKCRLGRRLVRLRWSAAATPPGKYHTHTHTPTNARAHTHTHTHTHTQLYNRTELSPVYRESKQLFDKILSTCLSHHTHTLFIRPHSFENKQSKEVSSVRPSFPLFPSTYSHTGKFSPSAGNSLYSKD